MSNPLTRAKKSRARECYLANRLPEAKALYARVTQLDRRDVEAWALLGAVHEQLGEYPEAEACLRQALSLQPNIPDGRLTLGNTLLKQGRIAEAETCYRQELKQRPDHAVAYNNLATVLVMRGNLDEAIDNLRRAVTLKPGYADAYANLGKALAKQGKVDEAKSCYQRAVQFNPRHVEARYALASLGAASVPDHAPHEYVKALFDDFAEYFDRHLTESLQYKVPERLSQIVRREVGMTAGGYDVADLGCGTGLCGPLFRDLARTLIGVDLSPKMIEKARARQIYDKLVVTDLLTFLREPGAAYDLILAADVLLYIGDLKKVFAAVAAVLRAGGSFAFSVESAKPDQDATYALTSTGRYVHNEMYVRELGQTHGLLQVACEHTVLRMESGSPVNGCIFLWRKPD